MLWILYLCLCGWLCSRHRELYCKQNVNECASLGCVIRFSMFISNCSLNSMNSIGDKCINIPKELSQSWQGTGKFFISFECRFYIRVAITRWVISILINEINIQWNLHSIQLLFCCRFVYFSSFEFEIRSRKRIIQQSDVFNEYKKYRHSQIIH